MPPFDAVVERAARTWAYARLVAAGESDARGFYDLRGSRFTVLADVDELSNFGYWRDVEPRDPDGLRRANEALFELVGDWGGLAAGQSILDVGCGFGHGAVHFASRCPGARIVGLNVSSVQLAGCRRRSAALGLERRVSFVEGCATAMPFADGDIDAVCCIDAALHFQTREEFFRQARRVLKTGGTIVVADMVLPEPQSRLQTWNIRSVCRGSQIPRDNLYDAETYLAKLRGAGFEIVRHARMYDDVLAPFQRYVRHHQDKTLKQPLLFLLMHAFLFQYPLDYLIVAARKS